MGAKVQWVGAVFGRLVVVDEVAKRCGNRAFLCQCDCGGTTIAQGCNLRSGNTTSCGCHRGEITRNRQQTHGESNSPEYQAWQNMKARCYRESDKEYKNYGGRGIGIAPEWASFGQFIADMGKKPSPKHSLDRLDVNQGYSDTNCRWASTIEQANNKRTSRRLEFEGFTLTVAEWARQIGVDPSNLRKRLVSGWGAERALLTP